MTNARDKANIPVLNFQSKGIDDNADATAITINSSEQVAIGTTSHSSGANITLSGQGFGTVGADSGSIAFGSNTSYQGRIYQDNASSDFFIENTYSSGEIAFKTNSSERMRLTTTGLGINNSAPSTELEVYGTIKAHEKSGLAQASILIDALATGNPHLAFQQAGTYKGYIHYLDSSDTICLNDGSGNGLHYSPTLQRLGIGTASPTGILECKSAGNTQVYITAGNSSASELFFGDAADVDVGKITYLHGSNAMKFQTNTSEAMRIDSSGRVMIGTTDIGYANQADNLTIGSASGNNGITIRSGTTNNSNIYFSDATGTGGGTFAGALLYNHNDNAMIFYGNSLERMRIDSSGNVGIGTSSPDNSLHVAYTDSTSYSNSTNDSGIQIENSNGTDNTFSQLHFRTGNADSYIRNIKTGTNLSSLAFLTDDGGTTGDVGEAMRIDSSGNLGIGTTSPGSYKLSIQDSGTCLLKFRGGSGNGLYQQFEVNNGATTIGYLGDGANLISGGSQTDMCLRGTNNIKFAIANFQKTTINSSGLNVHGALSKSSGSFKIDHPLSSKTNTHHLVHSFVEAPQADNIYRGKVNLVSGTATVNIDTVAGMSEGTFILLNREIQCFTSNETGWIAVKGSVSGNTLTITAQDNTCNDTISWMVIGERQDQHMYDTDWTDENGKVIVEPLKETEQQQP